MILHDYERHENVLEVHGNKITTIHTGDRVFEMDSQNRVNCDTFETFVKLIGRGFYNIYDMVVGIDENGEHLFINFGKLDINHIWVDIFVDNTTHHYTRVYGRFPENEWG